jgi:hypothetical protein
VRVLRECAAPDDFRSFGHRSRMNQIGYAVENSPASL